MLDLAWPVLYCTVPDIVSTASAFLSIFYNLAGQGQLALYNNNNFVCSSCFGRLCNRFERFRQSALSHGCGRTNSISFRSMAAILRSGKFLRLFSGVARNLAASSGKNDDNGLVTQHGLSFDRNFSQTNFSIQNVLPYLGVSDSGHAEDR